MTAHRIRLRRPWHCEPAGEGVRWRRPFNRPTGLGPAQRVWLVLEGLAVAGTAALNGEALGRLDRDRPECRFDVTDRLQVHNELVVELAASHPAAQPNSGSPPGEVSVEITTHDWKRG